MKIRTVEMLSDYLSEEIIWRKKEMTEMKKLIQLSESNQRRKLLIRAGIALLYAHFEGFTKITGSAYLEYVYYQRIPNNKISRNFLALSILDMSNKIGSSKNSSSFMNIVDFFLDQQSLRANIPFKTAINTESNLSSKVFKEVIFTLGFDYKQYESKEKLLDCKILGKRNCVAHGQDIDFDDIEYDEIHDCIIEILNCFRNQIENAVALKEYLISA